MERTLISQTAKEKFALYARKYNREELLETEDDFIVQIKLENGRNIVLAHSSEGNFYDCVCYPDFNRNRNNKHLTDTLVHFLTKDGASNELIYLMFWIVNGGEFPISLEYIYKSDMDIYLEWNRCVDDNVYIAIREEEDNVRRTYKEIKVKDYNEALKVYKEKVNEKRDELLKLTEDGDDGDIKLKTTEDKSWCLFELHNLANDEIVRYCDIRIDWCDGQPF